MGVVQQPAGTAAGFNTLMIVERWEAAQQINHCYPDLSIMAICPGDVVPDVRFDRLIIAVSIDVKFATWIDNLKSRLSFDVRTIRL